MSAGWAALSTAAAAVLHSSAPRRRLRAPSLIEIHTPTLLQATASLTALLSLEKQPASRAGARPHPPYTSRHTT